jgi:hypothetical protein
MGEVVGVDMLAGMRVSNDSQVADCPAMGGSEMARPARCFGWLQKNLT